MNYQFMMIISAVFLGLVIVVLVVIIIKKKRLSPKKFKQKWIDLQKYCASQETWPLVVIAADKLLDEALKKKRLKGKSMGERLVDAQRQIADNDRVWFAHNLAKKLTSDASIKLREADVKKSLIGIRQALKNLGALDEK